MTFLYDSFPSGQIGLTFTFRGPFAYKPVGYKKAKVYGDICCC